MADTHRTVYTAGADGSPVVEIESEVVRAETGEAREAFLSRVWAAYSGRPGLSVQLVDKGAGMHAVVEWRPERCDAGPLDGNR